MSAEEGKDVFTQFIHSTAGSIHTIILTLTYII